MLPPTLTISLLLAPPLLLIALVSSIWRKRSAVGGLEIVFLLSAVALWGLMSGVAKGFADFETKLLLTKIQYLGIVAVAPSCLAVAFSSRGWRFHTTPTGLALLALPALATYGMVLTTGQHGLFWHDAHVDSSGSIPQLVVEKGPAWWAHTAWSYLLLASSVAVLAGRWARRWAYYRSEAIAVLAAIGVPIACNLVYLSSQTDNASGATLDLTPFAFAVPAACLAWVLMFRDGIFNIVGFAHREVLDDLVDGALLVDLSGRLVYINRAACQSLGVASVRLPVPLEQVLGRFPDLVGPLSGRTVADTSSESTKDGSYELELRDEARGRIFDARITPLVDPQGRVTSRVLVLRDVTARKRSEEKVKLSEDGLRAMIDLLPQLIYARDLDGQFLMVNRAGAAAYGCEPKGLIGKNLRDVGLSPERVKWIGDGDREVVSTGEPLFREKSFVVGGEPRTLRTTKIPFRHPATGTTAVLSVSTDVTDQLRSEEQIRALAFYDSLTGLPNRRRFQRHLVHSIDTARRKDGKLALLFLDLDRFKEVNDRLGHTSGDHLLRDVAERLRMSVRLSDELAFPDLEEPRGTDREEGGGLQAGWLAGESSEGADGQNPVSRLAGDEFTILLTSVSEAINAAAVARRIIDAMSRPFQLGSHEIFVTASIGISLYPEDGLDADTLLRSADQAMYEAKRTGPNGFAFFDPSMNDVVLRRHEIESHLRYAQEFGELDLVYQPIYGTGSGEIAGAEALLRWKSAALGVVEPQEFVAVAEETGLIHEIGRWVLRRACDTYSQWVREGLAPPRIAVNVSASQLQQATFADEVERIIRESEANPEAIELELTESAVLANDRQTNETLQRLGGFGLRLALDDFGTGQSSLSNLRRFAFDRIKIDRSFVREIPGNREDANLTAAIIAMAHGLGLSVVAEGVETEEQVRFLRERSCEELQGFLLATPMTAAELGKRLHRRKPQ